MNKKIESKSKTEHNDKIDKKTIKRLLVYISSYKLKLFFVVISIVISALIGAISSLFLQILIDEHIYPLLVEAEKDFSGLLNAMIIMGTIFLIGVIATLIYNLLMVSIAQGVLKKLRDEMFGHMQELPIKYFDSKSHGDIMSYYTNDIDTLRQMIAQSLPQVLSSILTIISVFFAMLYLSIWLTIIVLVFIVLVQFIAIKTTKKSGKYFMKQQKSIGQLNGYVEEMISGLKVIKVFNREKEVEKGFIIKNNELCDNAINANKYANILMPMMNSFGYILYVLIAIIGGIMAVKGTNNLSFAGLGIITLGTIASFLQLSRSFIYPLAQVSQQLNAIIMAIAGASRIFEFLDVDKETDRGYVTLVNVLDEDGEIIESNKKTGKWAWKHPHSDGTTTYTVLKGEVCFYNVDFAYKEDELVLKNISINAKTGEKIAIVGSTGAGKTTITNLLNRFYDIADGKIRYDGININKIKKQDLRKSLGIVLQDVNLFTGTVLDNIRYGNLEASDEECIQAAILANADSFIRMLPNGYDTIISGDGNSLSQGQKQLISIARAEVADPPVMILDEATSSIDTRTEAIVQKGMDKLMKDRTVFVIAHRLSTIKNADVIMVLESGEIVEIGNHKELIEKKGKYYQLYTGAFELD